MTFALGIAAWPAAATFAERSSGADRVDFGGYVLLLVFASWAALLGLGVLATPLRLWDAWRSRRHQPTVQEVIERFLVGAAWRPWVVLLVVAGLFGIFLPELIRAFVDPMLPGFRVPSPLGDVLLNLGGTVLAAGLLHPVQRRMQENGSSRGEPDGGPR